ncbi:MAG: hypothetical protein H0W78_14385 [Planctomycetes bacterium]|nr:hypothetical protein [Planctomycetota bacterium]
MTPSTRGILITLSLSGIIIAVGLFILLSPVKRNRTPEPSAPIDQLRAQAQVIARTYRSFGATKVDRQEQHDVGLSVEICVATEPDVAAPVSPLEKQEPLAPSASAQVPADKPQTPFKNGELQIRDRSDPLHGRKVYALFARDELAFRLAPHNEQPVGQAVVKEAWAPEEITDASNSVTGVVHFQGRTYRPGEARGLFLIFKVDPATPGTDNGWVYATVAADRTTVTACGMIPQCADCHNKGGKDRLFGPIRH